MIARRPLITAIVSSPLYLLSAKLIAGAASFSKSTAKTDPLASGDFDRELHCKLSNLSEKQWHYAGQQYRERTEDLRLNEGERILATFVNDGFNSQTITISGLRHRLFSDIQITDHGIVLQPGSSVSVAMIADNPQAQAFIAFDFGGRVPITVRASDQIHPLVG